jgi:hypothetical protein
MQISDVLLTKLAKGEVNRDARALSAGSLAKKRVS